MSRVIKTGDFGLEIEIRQEAEGGRTEVWLNHDGPLSGFVIGLDANAGAAVLEAHAALGIVRDKLYAHLLRGRS